jgi:hypothetical protein
VAIFASREKVQDVVQTVRAAFQAAVVPTVIDVLVNGNDRLGRQLQQQLVLHVSRSDRVQVRVWLLGVGDKANAWNHYVHEIWPQTDCAFFLDGHCRPNADGFRALADGLSHAPQALAGSAVPMVGRTAGPWRDHLLTKGGMVGGFLALKGSTMQALRERRFYLPLGLYGFDGLLGAMFAFGMNPMQNSWQLQERIHVCAGAHWTTTPKKWWHMTDLLQQFSRMQRIALRVLVSGATRDFFELRRQLPETLPRTTQAFVLNWAERAPAAVREFIEGRPLCWWALQRLRLGPQDWSAAAQSASLVFGTSATPVRRRPAATPWMAGGGFQVAS